MKPFLILIGISVCFTFNNAHKSEVQQTILPCNGESLSGHYSKTHISSADGEISEVHIITTSNSTTVIETVRIFSKTVNKIPNNLYTRLFRENNMCLKNEFPLCITFLSLNVGAYEIEENAFINEPGCLKMLDLSSNNLNVSSIKALHQLTNLISLELDENNFSTLHSYIFQNFSNLEDLSISKSQIKIIEPFAFHGMSQLKRLVLAQNKLTCLLPDTFAGLSLLEILDLTHLPLISNYNQKGFRGLPESVEVFLDYKYQVQFHFNDTLLNPSIISKENYTDINYIAYEYCTPSVAIFKIILETFKTANFSLTHKRSILQPINNESRILIEINCECLTQIPKIVMMTEVNYDGISGTVIKIVNGLLPILPANLFGAYFIEQDPNEDTKFQSMCINELIIQDVELKEMDENSFNGEPGCLQILDLSNNSQSKLPTNKLTKLQNLKELLLNQNNFTTLPANGFLGLKRLEFLSLRNCRIETIDYLAFSGLNKLRYLFLDGNLFKIIPANLFGYLNKLKHLSILYMTPPTISDESFTGLPNDSFIDIMPLIYTEHRLHFEITLPNNLYTTVNFTSGGYVNITNSNDPYVKQFETIPLQEFPTNTNSGPPPYMKLSEMVVKSFAQLCSASGDYSSTKELQQMSMSPDKGTFILFKDLQLESKVTLFSMEVTFDKLHRKYLKIKNDISKDLKSMGIKNFTVDEDYNFKYFTNFTLDILMMVS